jgi:hypothetical protein
VESDTLLLLLLLLVCLLLLLLLPRSCAHFCSIAASVAALIGQKYMRSLTLLLLLLWRLESCGSSGCCSSCIAGPVRLKRRKSVADDSSNRRQLVNSLHAQAVKQGTCCHPQEGRVAVRQHEAAKLLSTRLGKLFTLALHCAQARQGPLAAPCCA